MAVVERKWDSKTQTWTKNYTPEKTTKNSKTTKSSKNKASNDTSNLTANSTSKKTPKGTVEKKVNKKTIRTLEGSLKVLVTNSTLKIKVGDTIYLRGLGKFLSGKYYVSAVERTLDGSNGYSQTCTVIKTNFRKTIKISASKSEKKTKVKASKTQVNDMNVAGSAAKKKRKIVAVKSKDDEISASIAEKSVLHKQHVVDKGETLYSIARKLYGDATRAKDIAELNGVTDATYTNLSLGQKLLLP